MCKKDKFSCSECSEFIAGLVSIENNSGINSIEKWISKDVEKCQIWDDTMFCDSAGIIPSCEWYQDFDNYDFTKPGILIIDDNPGIVSFLEDDLEEMNDEGLIDIAKYNIFKFTTKHAAYKLFGALRKYKDLNIKLAIIDITLGGSMKTYAGNIKLTGVDVFEPLLELNAKLRYIFYTGNQMNNHIKTISEIMKKYTNITGKKITDNILFKTQLNMNDRRAYLYEKLFK